MEGGTNRSHHTRSKAHGTRTELCWNWAEATSKVPNTKSPDSRTPRKYTSPSLIAADTVSSPRWNRVAVDTSMLTSE